MTDKPPREDWVNAHLGTSSQDTAKRLLTTPQPQAPPDAPILALRGVKARCVAGGASNFWIIGSDAAEPLLDGRYPMIGMSPTAYFIRVPGFNDLPYAVRRSELTRENHEVEGDTAPLAAAMKDVYG